MTGDVCEPCDGTGKRCRHCKRADGDCTCQGGPEIEDCEDCEGTGEEL